MSEIVRIPYKPNILMMLLVVVLFGGAAALFLSKMLNSETGLIVNRVLEFSANGAVYFFGVLFFFSCLFVLAGFWGLYVALLTKHEVVLTEDTISAPQNFFSGKVIKVNYSDIINLQTVRVQSHETFVILHPDGKLNITDKHLPSREIYEQLVRTVVEKTKAAPSELA